MLKGLYRIAGLAASLLIAVAAAQTPAPIKAGALQIEAPWLRATPGGAKVGAGYLRITNTGSEADRLTGASMPLAPRGEVHEMTMQNGVMHMGPLAQGLAIPPGKTVELKPGGFHLMFLDLKGALKQGEKVDVTLTFEKAGSVTVAFPVQGLGGAPHM
ncbi:MAG: periplasmic copper chaperone [Methylobacteriaceae bacterium]|jgi:copper(I)-binding protein|nr:periplasmic copper chaperone [Methylobacteriaceae bacterium]